ncbi:hypothetical protein FJTKL_13377 [Diaporthe vaccinii]|uniref:Large-conductance mechanosensitive channel n=1 Tax=Diaporthe vaccinii TaxID=105482 RepID=A0ABR4EAL4_9PEZI
MARTGENLSHAGKWSPSKGQGIDDVKVAAEEHPPAEPPENTPQSTPPRKTIHLDQPLLTNPQNSVAAAFTNVVTSFVSDILLPPLSVLLPLNANLDFKFAVLQAGATYSDLPHGYRTIEQAQADGAVIMAYGVFLNKTLNFIGLGSALYALAGLYQYLSKDPIIKHMVKCRYCRKRINEKSLRCVNCTSWLDGREENLRFHEFSR